jgi:hypothetical protein
MNSMETFLVATISPVDNYVTNSLKLFSYIWIPFENISSATLFLTVQLEI